MGAIDEAFHSAKGCHHVNALRDLPLAACLPVLLLSSAALGGIVVERLPEGWLQPRLARDPDGTLHRVCLVGDPKASDVLYSFRRPHATNWSLPVRVNQQPGSAVAIGTIRGPDIAIGQGGRVHVAWNGSSKAHPQLPNSAPLLCAQWDPARGTFAHEAIVNTGTRHLDGGAAIAADVSGQVWVLWHASPDGAPDDESSRRVFIAASTNSAVTFAPGRPISPPGLGACGCCGMAAHADGKGTLHALYRAASQDGSRDMVLLSSTDAGTTFAPRTVDRWKATQCPMSLPWLGDARDGTLAAWESGRRVLCGTVASGNLSQRWEPAGSGTRKHPVAVSDPTGRTLAVWSEGTGWQKGGAVEWQRMDPLGRPEGGVERREGLPTWSRPAAAVDADGNFLVLF